MVHYITTINGLLEMERTSFAREYEEFMADILHSEGLHTVGESSDKLSVLLKELNDNGFSFEFGLGKRSIVFDIVHKERCSNPDTKCLCEDKTYHVSIILAYDGFEILVSLVGGEPGYDVRNGDVTYHNTQEKVAAAKATLEHVEKRKSKIAGVIVKHSMLIVIGLLVCAIAMIFIRAILRDM